LLGASPVQGGEAAFIVPVIPNIHQRILDAVTTDPAAFDMKHWHHQTACGTTHCRAGFVVETAGEAGKKLEKQTSTIFAAMQIYHASSKIEVACPRFYEPDSIALADIKRCAELEGKSQS
jgi:hypothetical protein